MLTLDQIIPVKDRVLVVPDPVKTISDGGIHIPETVRADNPNYYTMTGTVVRVGSGRVDEDGVRVPMSVQAGDRVVFGRYAGKQIELADRSRAMMIRESEIVGKAEGEYVEPGYQAAKHKPVTGSARPADPGYDSPGNLVIR